MIPHAKSLTNFVNFYENSEEISNVCKILAKNIVGACERRFYTINNNLNMNDNKLMLVTTAVDSRYRLYVFPSYLKNYVKEQFKSNIKKHICFEANQSGDSSILPPEKSKPQHSVNFDPNKYSTYYSLFKIELNTATQEDEQKNSIDEEIEAQIKVFFKTESLNVETEEDKVLNWWNFNKTKYPYPVLQGNILLHHHLLCILKDYFLKLEVCTSKA